MVIAIPGLMKHYDVSYGRTHLQAEATLKGN